MAQQVTTPKGRVFMVDDEGVILNTGNEVAKPEPPKPHPVAVQMFASYQAISISNMNQRAVGIRTRLQQWTIDSYFRNAVQLATQLGVIPMPSNDANLQAFMPAVPAVSESADLQAISDRQDKMDAQFADTNKLIAQIAKKAGVFVD